jgi:hypothetical protein
LAGQADVEEAQNQHTQQLHQCVFSNGSQETKLEPSDFHA